MQSNQPPVQSFIDTSLSRRTLVRQGGGLAMAASLLSLGQLAWAQTRYPTRPLRMVLAFPPAGATDILARIIGQGMAAQLGTPVVVENKPGAGGMIGLDAGAKASADGYNVFLCALTNQAIAGHLYPKATSDITRDFEPIAMLANGAHLLNVHPSVPANTLPEFIAWLKANNGKINYASQGNGTLSHLEAELLQQRAGVTAIHIPYRGSSQALPDLIAGNVSFMFDSVAASQPFVQSGKLRSLAVATSKRVPIYPDLPTISEAELPGYDADNWFGLYAPKGTPVEICTRLSEVLEKVLADSALLDSLQDKGYIVNYGDAPQLAAVTARERAKWGKVIKAANINI